MKRSPTLIVLLSLLAGVLTPAAAVRAQPSPNRVLFQGLPDVPVFDVRRYGAKPGGGVDDTAGIQAAIDDAEAAGGRVFVPKGDHQANAALSGYGTGQYGITRRVRLRNIGASPSPRPRRVLLGAGGAQERPETGGEEGEASEATDDPEHHPAEESERRELQGRAFARAAPVGLALPTWAKARRALSVSPSAARARRGTWRGGQRGGLP